LTPVLSIILNFILDYMCIIVAVVWKGLKRIRSFAPKQAELTQVGEHESYFAATDTDGM